MVNRHHPFEKDVTLENQRGEDCEMLIKCTVAPGCEAKLSGPPEDCYPAEPPEVDDLRLYRHAGKSDGKDVYVEIPEKDWSFYGVDYEMLEAMMVEHANEQWEAASMEYDESKEERD